SREAGGRVVEAAHVCPRAPRRLRTRLFRREVEREGQRVRGLRVRRQASAGGEVLPVERRFDPVEQRAVLPGVLRLAQYLGGAGEQAGRVGEEGGRDEVLVGGRS